MTEMFAGADMASVSPELAFRDQTPVIHRRRVEPPLLPKPAVGKWPLVSFANADKRTECRACECILAILE